MKDLKTRCKKFIDELGVKTVRFCQNAGISASMYYKWLSNEVEISDYLQRKIADYLKKYGF